MKKYVFLGLLLLLIGCSKDNSNATALQPQPLPSPPTFLPSSTPSPVAASQALPELSKKETLGEVDGTNDLIDSFYFDGNGIKVSLNVDADEACFVYIRRSTPDRIGEIEMESFVRERAGLWRSYQTARLMAQTAGNKLNMYLNDELLTAYENPSISLEQEQAIRDFNERKSAFKLLLRQDLSISESAKRVYANQCQGLRNFYYREELPSLTQKEQLEFERNLKNTKE